MSTRLQAVLGALAIAGFIVIGVVIAYLVKSSQQPGHWSEAARTSFVEACNQKCRASPGVTPDRAPLCDEACLCSVDEAEKILSSAELAQVYLAQKTGVDSKELREKMEKVTTASRACAARAVGAAGRTK